MNLLGSKRIETDRLILRSTQKSDLKILWEILSIPEVNQYYLTCKLNSCWEKELPWQMKKLDRAQDNDVFQWSIVKKELNECIGQICVQENGDDQSIRDIGWFITPKEQRKGYAMEAASHILNYMFCEVEIRAIETCSATCNPASWRLMEKLGFQKRSDETHIIHYTFGGDVECCSYGLTNEEYLNFKNKSKKEADEIKTIIIEKQDQSLLERLLQLYLHDISLYFPITFNSFDGSYKYDNLEKYFNNSGNYPYFIKYKDEILGFILIDKEDKKYVFQEVFVLNNYKGTGIGKKAIFNILDKYKGKWIIKSLPNSLKAEQFWNSTISEYTNNNYKVEYVGKYNRAIFIFSNK